jgi:phage gp46-like protein
VGFPGAIAADKYDILAAIDKIPRVSSITSALLREGSALKSKLSSILMTGKRARASRSFWAFSSRCSTSPSRSASK